jgi:hypothetical protein
MAATTLVTGAVLAACGDGDSTTGTAVSDHRTGDHVVQHPRDHDQRSADERGPHERACAHLDDGRHDHESNVADDVDSGSTGR